MRRKNTILQTFTPFLIFVLTGVTGEVALDANGNRQIDYVIQIYGNGTWYTMYEWNSFTKTLTAVAAPPGGFPWKQDVSRFLAEPYSNVPSR